MGRHSSFRNLIAFQLSQRFFFITGAGNISGAQAAGHRLGPITFSPLDRPPTPLRAGVSSVARIAVSPARSVTPDSAMPNQSSAMKPERTKTMKQKTNIEALSKRRVPGIVLALLLCAVGSISTVQAQPVNDQCAGATPLVAGTPVNLNTVAATALNDPTPACQTDVGAGVWYTYTPTTTGPVTISTCGSSFDTVISVYTGLCGALQPLVNGCNDDNGPSCDGEQASITFNGVAGTVYRILIAGYSGATGTLTVTVNPTTNPPDGPVNDNCLGAILVSAGSTVTTDTTGATSTGDPTPSCQPDSGAAVWYSFTPTATGPVTVSTCGSEFDTVLSVYSGPCGTITPVAGACNDDNGPACAGEQASLTFNATAGTLYWFVVSGFSGATGNLTISVSGTNQPVGFNDECGQAIPMTAGTTYTANTEEATDDNDPTPDCNEEFTGGIWYTFTPVASGAVTISTCGSDFDTVVAVFTGTCGTFTPLICNDDDGPGCAGLQASVTFNGVAGTTYWILVGGAGETGNVSISATASSGPIGIPIITAQPQNQTVCIGEAASLQVIASSSEALEYQWRFNGEDLEGETSSTLNLADTQPEIAGAYSVVVANSQGSVTSSVATLVVNSPPTISVPPRDLTVVPGSTAEFNVIAAGGSPFTYQWIRDGNAIPGGSLPNLILSNVTTNNSGTYVIRVTNPCGAVESEAVALTVVNRAIFIGSTQAAPGVIVEVPVRLLSAGDENRVILTVLFDETLVSVSDVVLGADAADASLSWSTPESGQVQIDLQLDNDSVFASGERDLVRLQFQVVEEPPGPAVVLLTQGTPTQIYRVGNEPVPFAPSMGEILIDGEALPAPAISSGTGLFEEDFTLAVPAGGLPADRALRILISNLGVDSRGRPIQVYNANGSQNGIPYLQVSGPLAAGTIPVTIQFIVLDRTTIPSPTYQVEEVAVAQPPTLAGTPISIPMEDMTFANGAVYLKFPSLPGRTYYVQYSDDMVNWNTTLPAVTGNGGSIIWVDNGPPKTPSRPEDETQRFYRAFLAQ